MTHGAQDWYQYRRSGVSFPVGDMAELAARLGSPDTFDRRGDVIFLDSFEFGLNKWEVQTAGAASEGAITPTPVRTAGYSVHLAPAILTTNYTRIETLQPYPTLTRIGLEYSFSFDGHIRYIHLWIGAYTGALLATTRLLYNVATETLYYLTTGAVTTAFATNVKLRADPDLFHVAKLVINIDDLTHCRFILDDSQYNLEGIPLNIGPDATYSHLQIQISASSTDLDTGNAYIDDVILTVNEP